MASKPPFECPICGEDVPANAKACPSCGACDKTGWNEEAAAADGLDFPENDFDYEKFTQEEFGKPRKPRGMKMVWWITALLLLLVMGGLTIYNTLFGPL